MDEYDDEDLVFSGTNASPLNAADAAKRLLEETERVDAEGERFISPKSTTPVTSNVGIAKNKIAARLAQIRNPVASSGSSATASKVARSSAEIEIGYRAPTVMGQDLSSYVDHPTNHGFGVASTASFAPVTLPPPATVTASYYKPAGEPVSDASQDRGAAINRSMNMDIEEDIIDSTSSTTPFLLRRDSEGRNSASTTKSIAIQAKKYVIQGFTASQNMVMDWFDRAASLDSQGWKKLAVRASIVIVVFIVVRFLFMKIIHWR